MARDSSRTHIHLHASRHADIFEDFTTPIHLLHTLPTSKTTSQHSPFAATTSSATPNAHSRNSHTFPSHTTGTLLLSSTQPPLAPGNTPHLPPDELMIRQEDLPVNPEEEEDVVPDQHATFGITRARQTRERGWRDTQSLNDLVRGVGLGEGLEGIGLENGRRWIGSGGSRMGLAGGGVVGDSGRRSGPLR